MKVVLEIPDNKAASLMDVLRNISFVKIKSPEKEKEEYIQNIKDAVEEVKMDKKGEIKLKSARQLLNEL